MSTTTSIEWCDATWNPIRGCSRVSEGCRHCYAESVAHRFSGPGQPYEGLTVLGSQGPRWNGKVVLMETHLADPLRWQKPRRIFVNSMSDLFHESVSDVWIDRIFAVMALAPRHTFQILTKRPARMLRYLSQRYLPGRINDASIVCDNREVWSPNSDGSADGPAWPLPNVWLGVSIEDQATADARIPLLLQTPAAVRFISYEPALGPVDLRCLQYDGLVEIDSLTGDHGVYRPLQGRSGSRLDWVICGGESGHGARPMHPDWVRNMRDQCVAAGVPFFFKQWGEWAPDRPKGFCKLSSRRWSHEVIGLWPDGVMYNADSRHPDHRDGINQTTLYHSGKKLAGRLLDGREWNEMLKGATS